MGKVIHYQDSLFKTPLNITICGVIISDNIRVCSDWGKITCKKCLKKKSYITDISIDKAINRRLQKQSSFSSGLSTHVGII